MLEILNSKDVVFANGNQLKTDSRIVARSFERRHADVLRKIDVILKDLPNDFASTHFYAHVDFIKAGSVFRESKHYEMTEQGFMFLVMGFTGKKAAQLKVDFINAFEKMRLALMDRRDSFNDIRNQVLAEYKMEKEIASQSGRLLNRWGRRKKPELERKIESLEQTGQYRLLN